MHAESRWTCNCKPNTSTKYRCLSTHFNKVIVLLRIRHKGGFKYRDIVSPVRIKSRDIRVQCHFTPNVFTIQLTSEKIVKKYHMVFWRVCACSTSISKSRGQSSRGLNLVHRNVPPCFGFSFRQTAQSITQKVIKESVGHLSGHQ